MDILSTAAAIGIVSGAMVSLFVLIEKVSGCLSKWQGKVVEDAIRPLRDDVRDLNTYTRHHLGPNGTSPQLWTRVDRLIDDFNNHLRREREED